MSGDKYLDLADQNLDLKEISRFNFSQDEINNNVNLIETILNVGTGDTSPQLITDETPPEDILQLTSDPDLISDNGDNAAEGEGAKINENFDKVVYSEIDASQSPDPASDVEQQEIETMSDNPVVETSATEDSNNKTKTLAKTPSSIIEEDAEEDDDHNNVTEEEENNEELKFANISVKLLASHLEEIIKGTSVSPPIDRNDKEGAYGEAPTTITNLEDITTSVAAVDAPEAEDEFDDATVNNCPSSDHSSSSHICEKAEKLLETTGAKVGVTSQKDGRNKEESGNGVVQLVERNGGEHSENSLESESGVPLSITSSKVGKGSYSNQSSGSSATKTRSVSASKSSIRHVEVHERNTPVELKSKDGKPISPYLCKIFPLEDESGGKKSKSSQSLASQRGKKFVVDDRQNRILDGELTRAVEREKLKLIEMMCNYFTRKSTETTTTDTEDVLADGSTKETMMSWIMKDKKGEFEMSKGGSSDKSFNPMANKFRKTAFTQVSTRPSFCDKDQVTSSHNLFDVKGLGGMPDRIYLVGEQQDIRGAARRMYESLKILQKAIHLSDCFCFRNAPEMPLGDIFNQPGFQEFVDSTNEIEILQSVIGMISNCKDSIQCYLSSVQDASLVTKPGSCLTKIDSSNNGDQQPKIDEEIKELAAECKTLHPVGSSHSLAQAEEDKLRQGNSRNSILPQVHTFTEEQVNVTLSTYYTNTRQLIQTVMSDGHRYQIHFTSSRPSASLHGISQAKMEYIGLPSQMNVTTLLSTIHRCANYIDTRVACSSVWARQSKRFLLEYIERYLDQRYHPSTDLSWWRMRSMVKKLRKINVFAGIVREFSSELVEAISKLHFCMQKSLSLLDKLKQADMPGFSNDITNFDEISLGSDTEPGSAERLNKVNSNTLSKQELSVEQLYEKLKTSEEKDNVSVRVLLKILAVSMQETESVFRRGEYYVSNVPMTRRARRVLRFMNATSSQLSLSKDVQLGALIATFLSAIDKLSLFEEFICEQGADVRSKVHKLCTKIVRNLYDLRCYLCTQQAWSLNLSKNSFMRIKEINEIRRLRRLKKSDNFINEKMEFLRGSDRCLRDAVWYIA